MIMRARTPGQKHLTALQSLKIPQMEPSEFLQHWNVSYAVLAMVCGCSSRTVKRWFSRLDYCPPTLFHKFCLATVHKLWTSIS